MQSDTSPAPEAEQSVRVCSVSPAAWRTLFWLALAVGLWLRLIGLSYPPFDAHSFRQSQTLWTVENFYTHGIDLLYPKTNFTGYPATFVLELPLFQAAMALLYRLFGPHVEIVRLWNILFGAGTVWLLYRTTTLLLDRRTATLAAVIYWLAPLNVVYQRSVLIDPTSVFLALLALHQLALLLNVRDQPPVSPRTNAVRFTVFAVATLLTALIKTLYLWPVVCLVAWQVAARRLRINAQWIRVGIVFAIAGVCIVLWSMHVAKANSVSPVFRGAKLSAHIGFAELLRPEFYLEQVIRRPKTWVGVTGVLLFPLGLLAGWLERKDRQRAIALLVLALVPPTYLVVFAHINQPHDYYQLIITPFLAVVSANGARWLLDRVTRVTTGSRTFQRIAWTAAGAVLIAAGPLHYLAWKKQPHLLPELVRFQQYCAGKFIPNSSALFFASPEASGLHSESYPPEYLYALQLWGYGRIVDDLAAARRYYDEFAPPFPKLDYVVFYGLARPEWMPAEEFHLAMSDDEKRFYVFRRTDLQ